MTFGERLHQVIREVCAEYRRDDGAAPTITQAILAVSSEEQARQLRAKFAVHKTEGR